MLLLATSKLNRVQLFISKALINSNISHDDNVLSKELPKEFHDIEHESKNTNEKITA